MNASTRTPDRLLTLPRSPNLATSIRATAQVFEDPKSQALLEHLRQVAPSEASVLVIGETGTGKELVARHIHNLSARRNGPFVAVNCGAFSESLVEAELFGHEKGAFTGALAAKAGWFEEANGGTLFLDEIGDLPMPIQVKLLRVLQEREVVRLGSRKSIPIDVRLLASDAVHAERLLEDGVRREGARVFDLAHEAPARLLLVVTRDSARADLLLSVHHYAFDDVSLAVFAAELKTLLDDGRLGVLASTPERVAARERAALASGRLDRVAERWAERLLPLAKAPGAAPARPEESGGRAGQRLALPVSAAVHAACRALAERTSVSPFSAALQAFAEVLGAELGVDDLLVGVALAGRSRLEMQGLVGCFVNLLPLAVGLRPEQSVEWRLRQVGHDLLELLEHQDVPLECVTQALRQRGASGLPIRIACGAHNGRAAPAVDAGVRVEADFIPVPGARLDLTLWLEDQPQGWLAVWTGASAIFDLHRIERLHQAWERRLLANAGEPISKRMSPEGCNAS
uniref:sigma 54-interacting transcriptional regulator n=1 Tax=Pseudomonas aeruginosa TaxID=287 RepID=UPI003F58FDA7